MLSIRKIGFIGRTSRLFNRYLQILTILVKYGFDDIVERLRSNQYIEASLKFFSGENRLPVERLSRPVRIRLVLEELGPTFIKFGQILSTRTDLIPPDWIIELSKLQDHVPMRPFQEVRETIRAELKSDPEEIFSQIDENPIASASIGQVHRACLKNGREVAVKVQRKGLQRIIEVDIEIMMHLAMFMENHVENTNIYQPVKIVEEFARVIANEIDFNFEASNMERFATKFADDATVHIPEIFPEFSTERLLTMQYIRGIKISESELLLAAGNDTRLIVARGAAFILKQVFEHGFFHADPHPGNIFVLPDNVICLLDFGMVGTIDRQTREYFVDLIDGLVHRDESRVCKVLLKITEWDEEPDMRLLEKEASEFMGKHLFKPLKQIVIGKLLQDLLNLASRHGLKIPPDIFLMLKALGTVEGIARQLDPDFNMVAQAGPFIEKIKLARYQPQRIIDEIHQLLSDFVGFLDQFPRELLLITRMIRRRKIVLQLDHKGLETVIAASDRMSNRLSFSIIIAALIVGSALIVISKIPPLLFGISLIGMILFLAAAILGIWLLIAILRKGGL